MSSTEDRETTWYAPAGYGILAAIVLLSLLTLAAIIRYFQVRGLLYGQEQCTDCSKRIKKGEQVMLNYCAEGNIHLDSRICDRRPWFGFWLPARKIREDEEREREKCLRDIEELDAGSMG